MGNIMPEIEKSPVAKTRDLRDALRGSERVFFAGKPYRDAFCDVYDYAAELENKLILMAAERDAVWSELRGIIGEYDATDA